MVAPVATVATYLSLIMHAKVATTVDPLIQVVVVVVTEAVSRTLRYKYPQPGLDLELLQQQSKALTRLRSWTRLAAITF